MDDSIEQLKYPIGPWRWPKTVSPEDVAGWIDEIAAAPGQLRAAVDGLDEAQLDTRYRPEGWTLRQVVHHIADSHLNSQCRIRLALTEDEPTVKDYDEVAWAELADGRTAPIEASLDLIDGLHRRWVILAGSLTPAQLERVFHHPAHAQPLRVDKTLGLYAWHGKHHIAHITGLRERSGW